MCLSTRCANLITKENKANKQKKPCFMLYVTTINKRRVSGSKPKIMEKKHKRVMSHREVIDASKRTKL